MVDYSTVGEEVEGLGWGVGGSFAGGQATGHMRTAPTAVQLNAISSINQEMKMGVNRLSRKLPLFINVMN